MRGLQGHRLFLEGSEEPGISLEGDIQAGVGSLSQAAPHLLLPRPQIILPPKEMTWQTRVGKAAQGGWLVIRLHVFTFPAS